MTYQMVLNICQLIPLYYLETDFWLQKYIIHVDSANHPPHLNMF